MQPRKPAKAVTPPELARMIDALMAGRPAERPAIIVVGDDSVFAINPPRPAR